MQQWHLIYDDSCPVCLGAIDKVMRLDKAGLIIPTPLSNPILPDWLALPSHEELYKQMHLVSPAGKVFRGADAIERLLSIFPQSRVFGLVLSLPVIKQLSRICYGIVARNRMKISNSLPP